MLLSVENNTLRTELSSQLFYSLSIALFFQNSPNKASGLLFIFVHASAGHTHLLNNEIGISWVPKRPSTVFVSCKTPERLTRKAGPEVCGWQLHPVLNPDKKPTFKLKLTSMQVI